jgi:hypothetical protein
VRHRAHHLHDERLFESYIAERAGDAIDPPVAEHLNECATCGVRYRELASFMDTLREQGEAEADAIFTPERLRAQQQQIDRRLEHIGRPARVISFPTRIVRRTMDASRSRMAPRWLAAAAAAGLFVGVALGASYELHARRVPASTFVPHEVTARIAPIATRGTVPPDVASDDAFLSDLELALERPHTRELQAFDAFTPHVREVRNER